VDRVRDATAGGGIAAQADDPHVKGLGQPGEAPADIAQTDDQEALAAELVLPLGEIADHAAPHPPCLIVARLRQAAAQGQDQGHRVLGDRARVDAAGAGKANAAFCQLVARELVGAGADRLDETELPCAIEKAVLPQSRDHQHIGLTDMLLQGLGVADGETADAGVESRKPLVQPVGDVGKADRYLFLRGKHGRSRFDASLYHPVIGGRCGDEGKQ